VDHSADLAAYVKASFFSDRRRPLALAGPTGNALMPSTRDFVAALFAADEGAWRYLSGFVDASAAYALDVSELDATRRVVTGLEAPDGWRIDAEQAGGGLFLDLGSHTLDILDFLVGPLRDANGEATNFGKLYDVEDRVSLHFALENGASGVAKWDFFSEQHFDEIHIVGSEGKLRLSTFGNESVVLESGSKEETFDLPNPRTIQQPLIQTIVDSLRNGGACPSTGKSAARTSHVMDAALSSYYGGREGDFWAEPDAWPGRAE